MNLDCAVRVNDDAGDERANRRNKLVAIGALAEQFGKPGHVLAIPFD
ncbi:MAG TPA: hypothetical protein VFB29_00235 [Pseudolabrys sp.]|nr:hypothetical protein [Pseudolabrys sp.]